MTSLELMHENKNELFGFRSHVFVRLFVAEGKEILSNRWSRRALCSPAETCLAHLAPCSQKEADTWLRLHVEDAVQKGCRKVTIYVCTLDTWWDWLWLCSARVVGCPWCQVKFSIHSYSQNSCHGDSNTLSDTPSLPCFDWVNEGSMLLLENYL